MGTKVQRAVYEWVNISDDLVYEWVCFFKGKVYDWGWFRNTGSNTHTTITPKLPSLPDPPRACAPSEDADQPGHWPSLISLYYVLIG